MTNARLRGAVLLGVAASLGAAVPARAADESTPDKGLTQAKDSFESAQTAFVRGEYDTAAVRFLEAYEKKPYPAFLFNVAVSYEKAKLLEKAQQYFERYLQVDPNASDAAQVKLRLDVIAQLLAPPPPPPVAASPPAAGAPAPGAPPPGAPAAPGATPGTPPVAATPTSPPGAPSPPPTPLAPLP